MVECLSTSPSAGVMLRAPWFLLMVVGILLTNSVFANTGNKLSDVNSEEGAIDQLEAFLLARQQQQGEEHHTPTAVVQPQRKQLHPEEPLAQANEKKSQLDGDHQNSKKKSENIEFGVGPDDARYFAPSEADAASAPRFKNLQTRSFGQRNYQYDNYRYNPEDVVNPKQDIERNQQLYMQAGYPYTGGNEYLGFGSQIAEDDGYPSFGYQEPVAAEYNGNNYDTDGNYNNLYNVYAQRLADTNDASTSAFYKRLQEIVASGDIDTARRMLGGSDSRISDVLMKSALRLKATSQPESVRYLHYQARARQPTGVSPDAPVHHPQLQQPPETEYNPNEQTPNFNTDNSEPEATVKGGQVLVGAPQHRSQSLHSASLSKPVVVQSSNQDNLSDVFFTAVVTACTAAAVCAIVGTGVCWYRMNKNHRAAKDAEYPAYGVTGPSRDLSPGSGGDRTLAHSAHMYHYQQQKNQMIAIDKSGAGEAHGGGASDVDSEEEDGDDKDYTVYECPGLAPMSEMVVPNPMYLPEDATPASPILKGEMEKGDDEDIGLQRK